MPLSYKFAPADKMNISNFLPPFPLVVGRNRSRKTIIEQDKHSGDRVLDHLYLYWVEMALPCHSLGVTIPTPPQTGPPLMLTLTAKPRARPLNGNELQMGASLPSRRELFSQRCASVLWFPAQPPVNGCGGAGMKEHLEMEGIRAGAPQAGGFTAAAPVLWQCSLGRWCH